MNNRKQSLRFLIALCLAFGTITMGLSGGARADDDNDSRRSFSGSWQSVLLGQQIIFVELKQDGKKVKGNFTASFSDFKGSLDGKVQDGVFRFNWTNQAQSGKGQFTLTRDGQRFSGNIGIKGQPSPVPWNGMRKPRPSFGGKWDMVLDNNKNFELFLDQKNGKYKGTFSPGNGKITGEKEDDVLTFKWSRDDGSKGKGKFQLAEKGQVLKGKFVPAEGLGKEISVEARRAIVSFQGEWKWKTLDGSDIYARTISFRQKDTLINFQGDFTGIVMDDTFFFNWGATGLNHNGYMVMDEGGKSFTGVLNMDGGKSMETVGTFVKP